MRFFLVFTLFSPSIFAEPFYSLGTDYIVTTTTIPKEKRRPSVLDKKPVKIIDKELFQEWLESYFLNDWIEASD